MDVDVLENLKNKSKMVVVQGITMFIGYESMKSNKVETYLLYI